MVGSSIGPARTDRLMTRAGSRDVRHPYMPATVSCPFFFFFQAEDGIRDPLVTGVQTCALPIWPGPHPPPRCAPRPGRRSRRQRRAAPRFIVHRLLPDGRGGLPVPVAARPAPREEIGRASCRERV